MELQVGVVNYMYQGEGAYLGGGGGNRFSDRRIPPKKLFGFRIWRIFYTDLRILLQRIADLSNILARIVDFARNLVRILDCDFIVELLADPNLDKAIVGRRILLRIWADRRICIPLFTPPPQCWMRKLANCVILPHHLVKFGYSTYIGFSIKRNSCFVRMTHSSPQRNI
jgi:hypothetical protein